MVEKRAEFLAEQGGDRGLFLGEIQEPLSQLIAATQKTGRSEGKRRASAVLKNLVSVFNDEERLERIPVERFADGTHGGLLTHEHLSQILSWKDRVPWYIEGGKLQLLQQVVEDLTRDRIPPEAIKRDLPDLFNPSQDYYAERAEALGGGVWRHELRQGIEDFFISQGIKDPRAARIQEVHMNVALSEGVYLNKSFYDEGVVMGVYRTEGGIRDILITPKGIATMLTWEHFPRGRHAAGIGHDNLVALKWVLSELREEKGIELSPLEE